MQYFTLLTSFFVLAFTANTQNTYFPPNSNNNWDTLDPINLGWCDDSIQVLYEHLEEMNSKAFIVLKDGKIVLEKYFGTFTQDSLWYWASAGKTLRAFAVGIAQEENLLNITDTTSEYLGQGWTSLTSSQEEKITIWHQLTMTTGLDDGVPDPDCTNSNCLTYLDEPGDRWAYHNGPYTLLNNVVENASGISFNNYFTTRIKTPTGMDGLFIPVGSNSVYFSKARSMARFGLLMLNNGNWDGTPLMNDLNYFNDMITPSQNLNPAYGYLWWLNGQSSYMIPGFQISVNANLLPNAPQDTYSALGKNGQIISISPSNSLVVIRMGNSAGNGLVDFSMTDNIWYHLNKLECTNLEVDELTDNYLVSPNPFNDYITLKNISTIKKVSFYDLKGALVKQVTELTKQIPTSDLEKGAYLLSIETESGIFRQKILK